MDIEEATQLIQSRGGSLLELSGPGLPLYTVELDGMTYGPLIEREVISLLEGS